MNKLVLLALVFQATVLCTVFAANDDCSIVFSDGITIRDIPVVRFGVNILPIYDVPPTGVNRLGKAGLGCFMFPDNDTLISFYFEAAQTTNLLSATGESMFTGNDFPKYTSSYPRNYMVKTSQDFPQMNYVIVETYMYSNTDYMPTVAITKQTLVDHDFEDGQSLQVVIPAGQTVYVNDLTFPYNDSQLVLSVTTADAFPTVLANYNTDMGYATDTSQFSTLKGNSEKQGMNLIAPAHANMLSIKLTNDADKDVSAKIDVNASPALMVFSGEKQSSIVESMKYAWWDMRSVNTSRYNNYELYYEGADTINVRVYGGQSLLATTPDIALYSKTPLLSKSVSYDIPTFSLVDIDYLGLFNPTAESVELGLRPVDVLPSTSNTASVSVSVSKSPTRSTTPSAKSSSTASATKSVSFSPSATKSISRSSSPSKSMSKSASKSASKSVTPTVSRSISVTPSKSVSESKSLSSSTSVSSSRSMTPSRSFNASYSSSDSPSASISHSGSASVTPSKSRTPSRTRTPSRSHSSSITPTISITPSRSINASYSSSITPTISITPSRSINASYSTSKTPSRSHSSSITPTISITPSRSFNASYSSSGSPSTSFSSSVSITPSRSVNASYSSSGSVSRSITPSRSFNASYSSSGSVSRSLTPSRSFNASYSSIPSKSSRANNGTSSSGSEHHSSSGLTWWEILLIVLGVLFFVLLVAGAIAGYYFYQKQNQGYVSIQQS